MHVWGRHSCSSREDGHKKEVGGKGRAIKLETRRLPSYTLKEYDKSENQGRESQKGLYELLILGFMFIYSFNLLCIRKHAIILQSIISCILLPKIRVKEGGRYKEKILNIVYE